MGAPFICPVLYKRFLNKVFCEVFEYIYTKMEISVGSDHLTWNIFLLNKWIYLSLPTYKTTENVPLNWLTLLLYQYDIIKYNAVK